MIRDTLLVIDDSELDLAILNEIFKNLFQVVCLSDAHQGLSFLKQNRERICAVLLDICLGRRGVGFAVLYQLQVEQTTSDLPVILITTDANEKDVRASVERGAVDFLVKPVDPHAVQERVCAAVRKAWPEGSTILDHPQEEETQKEGEARSFFQDLTLEEARHLSKRWLDTLCRFCRYRPELSMDAYRQLGRLAGALAHVYVEQHPDGPLTQEEAELIGLAAPFCDIGRLGLPVGEETASHVIFTGNPGTGKTTVARLLGRIYRALGLLSKGEVISTERRELVGEYIGQTEEKMNAILRRARGNVLFIDEAYSLCTDSDDRRDYGRHVVESLLSVLTEPHPDMVVVLAGYDDEMERLMQSNPGLKSRFPYKFHFDDYTADELMQIAGLTLERGGYRLTPEARELLRDTVENALAHKDRSFANARWVNRFVTSGILPAMARRVMAMDVAGKDVELYCTVERADVAEAIRLRATASASDAKSRPRIGFKA